MKVKDEKLQVRIFGFHFVIAPLHIVIMAGLATSVIVLFWKFVLPEWITSGFHWNR